jgi:hypothetical protein
LVRLWFIVSTILVIWDLNYLFWRPRSMTATGGDLYPSFPQSFPHRSAARSAWIWKPYSLYAEIDYNVSVDARPAGLA